MKRVKKIVSAAIVLAMIGLMPGPGAYEAAAQSFGISARAGKTGTRSAPIKLNFGAGTLGTVGSVKIHTLTNTALPGALTPTPRVQTFSGSSAADLPASVAFPLSQNAEAFSWVANTQGIIQPSRETLPELTRPGLQNVVPGVRSNDSTGKSQSLDLPQGRVADLSAGDARSMGRSIMDKILGRRSIKGDGDVPVMGMARKGSSGQGRRHSLRKSSKKDMPPVEDGVDNAGSINGLENLDELGNERRRQDPGPDDVYDQFNHSRGGGNSVLFGMVMGGMVALLTGMSPLALAAAYIFTVVPSLVLHEMGHAMVADRLGDPTPRLAGRLGWRLSDLKTHINPWYTVIVPLVLIMSSGFFFAAAEPVEPDESNFKNPRWGILMTALAGPAVNLSLAVVGALAYLAVGALGLPALLAMGAQIFVFMNVLLAAINLLPVFPLDGHHVLGSLLPPKMSRAVERFYETAWGPLKLLPMVVAFLALSTPLIFGIEFLTAFLLSGSLASLVTLGVAGLAGVAGWGKLIFGGRRGRR